MESNIDWGRIVMDKLEYGKQNAAVTLLQMVFFRWWMSMTLKQ